MYQGIGRARQLYMVQLYVKLGLVLHSAVCLERRVIAEPVRLAQTCRQHSGPG